LSVEENLEDDEEDSRWERNFWRAYDGINRSDIELLKRGLKNSVELQQAIVKQVSA
jgi:hypothetical protein